MRKNNTEVHLWKNLGVDKWKGRLAAAKNADMSKVRERVAGASAAVQQSLGKALKRDKKPDKSAAPSSAGSQQDQQKMTRAQALETLGLDSDANEREIDAALAKEQKRRQNGLNGSDHAMVAKIDAAREILRGK